MGKIDPKKRAPAPTKADAPAKKPIITPAPPNRAIARRGPAPGEETAVALRPAIDELLFADAGSGMEGMKQEDFAIPRLAILQALSPQVNKRDENYIEGAEAGMIYDNVSGNLYDGQEGILLVVVSYRRAHLQWWPRDSNKGKGFIKDWGADPSILNQTTRSDKGANLLKDGSEIVATAEYFAFLVDEATGDFDRVLVAMNKTQMIKAKKFNTIASSLMVQVSGQPRQAPLFFRAYRFKTKPESNDKGNWFGWEIVPAQALLVNDMGMEVLPYGERLYLEARAFRQQVLTGGVKVAAPMEDGHIGASAGASDDAPM
jgi:hypothetical protein